jgi:Tol biopolymer transport system component
MGEVYRARDTRLGRDVAVKILPAEFAADPVRKQRFEREARTISGLTHPNICTLHDMGSQDGVDYLVMECVEGETLAKRLEKGPLPLEQVLKYGAQIADALDRAHRSGVVHRDLKPGNIMLTSTGAKLLDFGLAKPAAALAAAATLTASAKGSPVTEQGMIVGTFQYMSPEQVEGKDVDARSDIFSLGAVLYEMVTGKQAFEGKSQFSVASAILEKEPAPISTIKPMTPPVLDYAVKKCLAKAPDERWQNASDLASQLKWIAEAGTQTAGVAVSRATPKFRERVAWLIAAIALIAALGLLLSFRSRTDTASHDVMHVDINSPPGVEPLPWGIGFAISPDGRTATMTGVKDGVQRLFVRRLDRPDAVEISDTASVFTLAFSPDSKSVVIFSQATGSLTRLSLEDQQRSVVASGVGGTPALAWGEAGIIYTRGGTLWITSPQGGAGKQLTTLDEKRHEVLHVEPLVLPGGRTILFSSLGADVGTERIEAVQASGGERTVVIDHATTPVWSPTGHLLFSRDGALLAVPFDPNSVSVRGTAVPIIPAGIVNAGLRGNLQLQVSSSGTLLFVPANFASKRVLSVARDGSELDLKLAEGWYATPRISPDGHRLLIGTGGSAVDTLDLLRGTRERLIREAAGTSFPTWTADGKGVALRRFGVPFWVAADGSGKAGPIPAGGLNDFPSAPGPDADSILCTRNQPETSADIFLISISGKFAPKQLIATPAWEGAAQLSPDGHWMVYQSNASGQAEIYVRRYPALDRAWPVSEGGGVQPRWSSTGREIYYRNGHHMMAVAFGGTGVEPSLGKPAALFADEYDFGMGTATANYDVTRDGRFIMLRRGPQGGTLRVVINWTEEVKQILAAGGVH